MSFLIIKVTGRNCRELIPLCKLTLTQLIIELVIVCQYKELSSHLLKIEILSVMDKVIYTMSYTEYQRTVFISSARFTPGIKIQSTNTN